VRILAAQLASAGTVVDEVPPNPCRRSRGVVRPGTDSVAGMRKPDVTIPDGTPPAELVIDDITVGEGDEAVAGRDVTVHYVGVSWSTGKQFDASWDRMEPFRFGLGQRQVIQGWDDGVQGMKVGGRRRLTIPPEMGYGAAGAGGVIAPNETLVFVVDLLGVG